MADATTAEQVLQWGVARDAFNDAMATVYAADEYGNFPHLKDKGARKQIVVAMVSLANTSASLAQLAVQLGVPEFPLLSLVKQLRSVAPLCVQLQVDSFNYQLVDDAEIVVQQIAKAGDASGRTGMPEDAGDREVDYGWGPALTFEVVCDEILVRKSESGAAAEILAGDSAMRAMVMERVRSGDLEKLRDDKASQYLTPKGRLCEVGLIKREGERIIVTKSGAQAWAKKRPQS